MCWWWQLDRSYWDQPWFVALNGGDGIGGGATHSDTALPSGTPRTICAPPPAAPPRASLSWLTPLFKGVGGVLLGREETAAEAFLWSSVLGGPAQPWPISPSCLPLAGVPVTHPHHQRRPAGHCDRAVLRHVGACQCPCCHTVLLASEYFLQKGIWVPSRVHLVLQGCAGGI